MAANEHQFLAKIADKLQTGHFSQALKVARTAAKKFPSNPSFSSQAGLALAHMGKHREAAVQFSATLKLASGHRETENNLMQALVLSDQVEKVDALFARLSRVRQTKEDLNYLRAMSLIRRGDSHAAVLFLDEALRATPNSPLLLNLRVSALSSFGRDREALADLETISRLSPNDPAPLLLAGNTLIRLNRMTEAEEMLANALALAPESAEAHENLAIYYGMVGNRDAAIKHYKQVVSIAPDHGMPYFQLAKHKAFENDKDLLGQLQQAKRRLMDSSQQSSQNLALIEFAQARICQTLGDYEGEARHLSTANRIEANNRPYDYKGAKAQFRELCQVKLTGQARETLIQTRPIFVIGLPRSGTTLVEQILGQSPLVSGLGELAAGDALAEQVLSSNRNVQTAEHAAEFYLQALPDLPDTARFFVDKLPGNYRHIALLHAAFPQAKFLNLVRDPRDIALSMWRGFFSAPGLNFTFDQKSMATEMNLYQAYMREWRMRPELPILDVNYQDLVSDPTKATRAIAEFCGLDWSEDMLHPEQNKDSVRTASGQQVREGIHQRSVSAWKTFEKPLAVFIRELDRDLWPDLG